MISVTALMAGLAGWLVTYLLFIRSSKGDERPGMRILMSFVAGTGIALIVSAIPALLFVAESSQASPATLVPAGLLLVGTLCARAGQKAWVAGQVLSSTPVSRIRSASQGWVKLRGQAVFDQPVYSRTGNIPCLYFTETTQRYTRHTRQVQDPQTKQWRTETYYTWDHYSSYAAATPFRLTDGTGEVAVDIRAAVFEPGHWASFYNGRPGSGGAFPREGDLRTTVRFIALDSQLEAAGLLRHGVLTRHPAMGAALVGEGSLSGTATGKKLGGCLGMTAGGAMVAAALLSPPVLATVAMETEGMEFEAALAIAFLGAAIGVILLGWMVILYNAIVSLKRQAERAWSDIDVSLQMRWDLVPNLVETVKAYAQHERQIFEAAMAARARALEARDRRTRIHAEERLERSLPSLLAVAEAYPQLRASENFLKLQQQLQEIEDAIADRREIYNDSATNFNTFIQSFPGLLMAGAMSEKPLPLFQAEPAARRHPLS